MKSRAGTAAGRGDLPALARSQYQFSRASRHETRTSWDRHSRRMPPQADMAIAAPVAIMHTIGTTTAVPRTEEEILKID